MLLINPILVSYFLCQTLIGNMILVAHENQGIALNVLELQQLWSVDELLIGNRYLVIRVSGIPMGERNCLLAADQQFGIGVNTRFKKTWWFRRLTGIFNITSNWPRVIRTCEILKLANMDEYGCYVQLYFYDKLSSLRPSDKSDSSVKHFWGTRFSAIRHETCMILHVNLLPTSANYYRHSVNCSKHSANCSRHSANCYKHSANRSRHLVNCCMHSACYFIHSASGCRHQS
jgi:hypothetical protein